MCEILAFVDCRIRDKYISYLKDKDLRKPVRENRQSIIISYRIPVFRYRTLEKLIHKL